MMQSSALQNGSQHWGCKMVRKRGQFSYETSSNAPDLIEQINRLGEMKNSPYWDRSFASIAGMILSEAVQKEIKKYERQED